MENLSRRVAEVSIYDLANPSSAKRLNSRSVRRWISRTLVAAFNQIQGGGAHSGLLR